MSAPAPPVAHGRRVFRNTLISGGLFTGLFVGAMKVTGEKDAEEEEETADEQPATEPIEAEN